MQERETIIIEGKNVLVQTAQLDRMSLDDFIELYHAHVPHREDQARVVYDAASKWADEQYTQRQKGKAT